MLLSLCIYKKNIHMIVCLVHFWYVMLLPQLINLVMLAYVRWCSVHCI